MFKHLFKLIWNKKKQNFLFLSEILVSFMVIFTVFSLLVFYYQNYSKPLGFRYERVWALNFNNSLKTKNIDSLSLFYTNIKATIKSLPQVEEVSFSGGNIPYSNSMNTRGLSSRGKKFDRVDNFQVEDSYSRVLGIKLLEGRWFNTEDGIGKNKRVVISAKLKESMFGQESAVGKLIGDNEDKEKMMVVGVAEDVKSGGDYWPAGYAMYNRMDTASWRWVGTAVIKVSANADAAFENRLLKLLSGVVKDSNLEIQYMTEMRESKNQATEIPMIIFMIIAGFLIINVALGLFGVLWYNINKRRGEIGLRRAIGATGNGIAFQLVAESLLLATISLALGCFFAIQFPLLNVFNVAASVYLLAILFAVLFIYTLVLVCSLYPGKQAAAIHPAIALHEE